jgi:hypothetical protein
MNSQIVTLAVVFQILSESVHLHPSGVLGESKIASFLAYQSSERHASRVRLTVRHRKNKITYTNKIVQLITGSYGCGIKKVNVNVLHPAKILPRKASLLDKGAFTNQCSRVCKHQMIDQSGVY